MIRVLALLIGLMFLAAAITASDDQRPLVSDLEGPVQHSGDLRSAGTYQEIVPPERFEGDGDALVIFAHQDTVTALCGRASDGREPIACAFEATSKTPALIALPNPCSIADVDLYAAIVCHELGHTNGWPATHGD